MYSINIQKNTIHVCLTLFVLVFVWTIHQYFFLNFGFVHNECTTKQQATELNNRTKYNSIYSQQNSLLKLQQKCKLNNLPKLQSMHKSNSTNNEKKFLLTLTHTHTIYLYLSISLYFLPHFSFFYDMSTHWDKLFFFFSNKKKTNTNNKTTRINWIYFLSFILLFL